jgi:hypothetical protein
VESRTKGLAETRKQDGGEAMSESIILEKLQKKLNSVCSYNIITDLKNDEEMFRLFSFKINGKDYLIEWWCNVCYLKFDDIQVPFDDIEFSGTWPNEFKTNLQLYYNGVTSFVLGITKYDEVKQ